MDKLRFEGPRPSLDAVKKHLGRMAARVPKTDPVHFAGRTGIIEAVLGAAESLPPEGDRSQSFAILGAPGVGKTALINEIARRLEEGRKAATVMCSSVPGSEHEVEQVYMSVAEKLLARPLDDELRTTTTRTVEGGLGLGGTRVGGDRGTILPPRTIKSVKDIARLAPRAGWPPVRRVVLFVDEIQGVRPGSAAAKMLFALHNQGEVPVLLVCAGLSSGMRRLVDADLTRVGNIVGLGPLNKDETKDEPFEATLKAMEKTGERLRIPGDPATLHSLARTLADESDGWPMHIVNYLRGVWADLAGQDAPSFDRVDVDRVLAKGHALREEYYNERVSASDAPIEVLRALLRAVAAGEEPGATRLSEVGAAAVIARAVEELEDEAMKDWTRGLLSRGKIGLDRMVHAGIVAVDKERRCVAPVPSLAAHIFSPQSDEGRLRA